MTVYSSLDMTEMLETKREKEARSEMIPKPPKEHLITFNFSNIRATDSTSKQIGLDGWNQLVHAYCHHFSSQALYRLSYQAPKNLMSSSITLEFVFFFFFFFFFGASVQNVTNSMERDSPIRTPLPPLSMSSLQTIGDFENVQPFSSHVFLSHS